MIHRCSSGTLCRVTYRSSKDVILKDNACEPKRSRVFPVLAGFDWPAVMVYKWRSGGRILWMHFRTGH